MLLRFSLIDSIQVLKVLSKEGIPVLVFNKGSFDCLQHVVPPNSVVFLLDLNCKNTSTILKEVKILKNI